MLLLLFYLNDLMQALDYLVSEYGIDSWTMESKMQYN